MILMILLLAIAAACLYFAYQNPDFREKAVAFAAAIGAFAAAFWEQISALL